MQDNLFHVIKNGKSGFINNKGEVIIDFKFDGVSSFSEGLARIFVNKKVGYIDTKGNIKIEPQFDDAMWFSEGKAVVKVGDKRGYINTEGRYIIEPIYYECSAFENGMARVREDMFSSGCFINPKGNIVLKGPDFMVSKYREGLINCSENDNWGFIDINGNFIIPAIYKYARNFCEGKAAVVLQKDKNGKPNKKRLYGFVNKENEMIIPPVFQGSDIEFSEGLCAIWNDGYGYINDKGDIVIPCDFDLGEHFSEGLAVFKPKGKNTNYGFIDKAGNIVIDPIFNSASNFKDGLASVVVCTKSDNFRYGLIDKSGNYIWEPTR